MHLVDYKRKIRDLIELASRTMNSTQVVGGPLGSSWVDKELFAEFRTSSLSFILVLYGSEHPYYASFGSVVRRNTPSDTEKGRGILKAISTEIDDGLLISVKGILSAEIFTDFLEMAEHLLAEGYKDPAAVLVGGVLEEHLRQLCTKHGIAVAETRFEKTIPKRADVLNAELTKAGIYNKLDQKQITMCLDIRNKAAHAKYAEYTGEQVKLMLQAATEFISRHKI